MFRVGNDIVELSSQTAAIKHLDQRFYDVDEYHIPNPFEKYWKARFLIQ